MAGEAENAALDTKMTFRMPAPLHRRFKIVLAHDGRSAQEILNGMLESWVRRKEEEIGTDKGAA